MTFAEAIKSGFKNYVKFTGRASRSEYWWFQLFYILCLIIPASLMMGEITSGSAGLGTTLYYILVLAFLLPGLGLAFRRLHDTNRSAWWLLLSFVPFGGIAILVFLCLPGTSGPNKYGAGPFMTQIANTFE
ncbi:DUF805 domain-containing protein [Asticcacaulis sp. 201]|uniref:DUF805 domain-containing protein n=1 Tax=Asticcacaulis sp. 201 TaxID=3028787 RepID=UPI0029170197|nr:DUF805 domain-containing protein [Asticcacaulis sp. 201]MDV6331819.1 DUF805 domain-containing protein [Asticcacaulis sp. 201]